MHFSIYAASFAVLVGLSCHVSNADENPFAGGRCAAGTPSTFIGPFPAQSHFPTADMVNTAQSSIGAIEIAPTDEAIKFCSGVLITPNYFLTAAHCTTLNGSLEGKSVSFNFQFLRGKSTKQKHVRILSVISNGGVPLIREGYDYAILKLEGAPGNEFGYFPLRKRENLAIGELIYSIHHPAGLHKAVNTGNVLSPSAAQSFPGLNDYKYLTTSNMNLAEGSSGGPVFDSSNMIIGINSLGNCSRSFLPTHPNFPLGMQNAILKLSAIYSRDAIVRKLIDSGYNSDDPLFKL